MAAGGRLHAQHDVCAGQLCFQPAHEFRQDVPLAKELLKGGKLQNENHNEVRARFYSNRDVLGASCLRPTWRRTWWSSGWGRRKHGERSLFLFVVEPWKLRGWKSLQRTQLIWRKDARTIALAEHPTLQQA